MARSGRAGQGRSRTQRRQQAQREQRAKQPRQRQEQPESQAKQPRQRQEQSESQAKQPRQREEQRSPQTKQPRQREGQAPPQQERQPARQRRIGIVGITLAVVVAAAVVMIAVRFASGDQESPPTDDSDPTRVIAALTTVPAAVLDEIGRGEGKVTEPPKSISGQPPLTADGKPLVLYIGAEYCPFCAVQRWAVVVALSRFGTFGDLRLTRSAGPPEPLPWTPTPTFHGASYTSQYVAFQGVETASNKLKGGRYAPLDRLTAQQQRVMKTVNAPPYVPKQAKGAIPLLDLGNRYIVSGASFDPRPLKDKSALQIAEALSDPRSPIAVAVGGTANAITTAICELTNDQPGEVCSGRAATAFEGKL